MQERVNAMIDRKKGTKKIMRSVWIPSICLIVLAAILLAEQISIIPTNQGFDDFLWDEDYYTYLMAQKTEAAKSYKTLLVYASDDDESNLVYENVRYVLDSFFVFTDSVGIITNCEFDESHEESDDNEGPEDNESLTDSTVERTIEAYSHNIFDLTKEYDSVVICTNDLAALNVMVNQIRNFVNNGGKLLMAAGLYVDPDIFAAQPEALAAWWEILGIEPNKEMSEHEVVSLEFSSTLMPGAKNMQFSDDVVSGTSLMCELTSEVKVHAIDFESDNAPLIWSVKNENGCVAVCNADLMDSKADRGIISALYSDLYPAFAYTVINAAVYCIDDFPSPAPAGYDDNVLSQYGYTVSDFISNVWLPSMLTISDKYNIPYSTFIIQTYDDNTTGPFNDTTNRTDAVLNASQILKHGGEIGIHGYNHQPLTLQGYQFDKENEGYVSWNSIQDMLASINAVLNYAQSIVGDAAIQAYIAPSNVISQEALTEMMSLIEDLRVYAGVYIGTPDQFVQEFEVLNNGTVFFPRLTADMQMEDSEWWLQINELAYHYVESNFIHPDDILDEERSDGGDFSQMLSAYEKMVSWNTQMALKPSTISQGAAAVQRYAYSSIEQELTEKGMVIRVRNLVDHVYVMLRTDGREPVVETGATITKIDEGSYVLDITQEELEIKWK